MPRAASTAVWRPTAASRSSAANAKSFASDFAIPWSARREDCARGARAPLRAARSISFEGARFGETN